MSKILVTQSSIPSIEEYTKEIQDIWNDMCLTNMGSKHVELEKRLEDRLKVKNVTLFTNGHMALYTAIKLFNFPAGGEVITTPFTFASTTHAISQNGLVPIFCDIDPIDYVIDTDKIEGLITDKTVAIVPVHVYGHICDVEKIEQIAKKHNLKVIYDAAHAFNVEYKGKGIGEYGDVSMFSFHATKVFNTIEGGCLAYGDDSLKLELDAFKNFGMRSPEDVPYVGMNCKMNEFCAAMGICNLRHLDEIITKRKKVVEQYDLRLKDVPGIAISKMQEGVTSSNYAYYPVVFNEEVFGKNRDEVMQKLGEKDIFTRKYFYPLTSDFECYNKLSHGNTPNAKWVAERVLCLPLYADLPLDDVNKICDIIISLTEEKND